MSSDSSQDTPKSNDSAMGSYINSLLERFKSKHYQTVTDYRYDISQQGLEILAIKQGKRGLVLPEPAQCIMVQKIPLKERQEVDAFSGVCTKYALDNYRTRVGLIVIPVALNDDFPDELKKWIREEERQKHWDAFEFPVLASVSKNELSYYLKTPFWGAVYWDKIRKITDEMLHF